MKPEIIQNGEFIEVIGHYDDEVQCAKMTLLAELYAVEHRDGYAKFRLEDADKLGLVNERLEFIPPSVLFYGLGLDIPVYVWVNDTYAEFIGDIGTLPTSQSSEGSASVSNGSVITLSTSSTSKTPITSYKITNLASSVGDYTFTDNTITVIEGSYSDYLTLTVTPATPRVSIDLTTLSGWSGLSDGSHSITVKAKATGYRDSEASQAVNVTKAPAGYTVTITTGGVPAYEVAAGYSFDDGATWTYIPVSDPPGETRTVTLSGVTQIKLRSKGYPGAIVSTILGLDIRNTPTIISDNIILTQDVDDIILRGSF